MSFLSSFRFVVPCLALFFAAAPALADDGDDDAKEEASEKKEAAPEAAVKAEGEVAGHHEEKEEWAENRNFLTAFGGFTFARAESAEGEGAAAGETWETAATWGLDYSFRINKWIGAGVFFDFAAGGIQELLVGPCVFIFPWEGLFIELSPSMERTPDGELHFVGRAALGYEWELTPDFLVGVYGAADYVRGGFAFVPGVTMGFGF